MIDWNQELQGCAEVSKTSNGSCEVKLTAAEKWTCFHGHFPHNPILPAVAMIDVSQKLIETFVENNKPSRLRRIEQFRVKAPVTAGSQIAVQILNEKPKEYRLRWQSRTEAEKIYCEMVLELDFAFTASATN